MDSSIYRSVNHLSRRTPWLHPAAVCFAKYGIGLFALALLVAWWQGRRESDPAIVARAVSTGLAHGVGGLALVNIAIATLWH